MAYPTLITNDSFPVQYVRRAAKRVFSPPGTGGVRFVLSSVGSGSPLLIRMYKSTNYGQTWAAVDTGNDLECEPNIGDTPLDAILDPDDDTKIIVCWVKTRTTTGSPVQEVGEHCITTFDMTSSTWGSHSTGGPGAFDAGGSVATASGDSNYTGVYFNICKDSADGSIWLTYLQMVDAGTAVGGTGAYMMRPAIRNLDSGGTWGSETILMAEPTVLANYKPCGICIGDSSRVHVIAIQYTMDNVGGFDAINFYITAYHQSYLSATLGTVQLVEDFVFDGGEWDNSISAIATRDVSGTTELLFGYATADVGDFFDPSLATPRIARAISATDPSWTLETLPGVDYTGQNVFGYNWCAPLAHGSSILVAYTNWTHFSGSNVADVWKSEYVSGAWQAATLVYAAPVLEFTIGGAAYCSLVNDGASFGVHISDSNVFQDYYYEIPDPPAPPTSTARNYIY